MMAVMTAVISKLCTLPAVAVAIRCWRLESNEFNWVSRRPAPVILLCFRVTGLLVLVYLFRLFLNGNTRMPDNEPVMLCCFCTLPHTGFCVAKFVGYSATHIDKNAHTDASLLLASLCIHAFRRVPIPPISTSHRWDKLAPSLPNFLSYLDMTFSIDTSPITSGKSSG